MGKDSVDKTQEEIVEEISKALGNSGYLLENILKELDKLEKSLELVEEVGKYNSLVDTYNTLRKDAVFRKDMLKIHREAVGIREHGYLDEYYPIPPKKRKK